MISLYRTNKSLVFIILAFLFFDFNLYSQDELYQNESEQEENIQEENFFFDYLLNDSLPEWDEENSSPYINPYLLPVIFDGKFSDDTSVKIPSYIKANKIFFPVLDSIGDQLCKEDYIENLRKKTYRHYVSSHVLSVKYSKDNLPHEVTTPLDISPKLSVFQNLFKVEAQYDKDKIETMDYFKPKRRYWQFNGSSLLQFSQNYISENWYKGGVGNQNLLSVHNFTANYKKDKIQLNNYIEWKLSFYTNPNDTLRNFRIGDDLVRIYSDFGIRAFSKWFYSTNIEIKTQLFKNYRENSTEAISSILSPININMGILGMKYQLDKSYKTDKHKKLSISADVSPLSVQYTYISNSEVNPSRFGIEEGKNYLLDLGSTINAKISVSFNRHISFSSRFKFFTNYEKNIFESENELNMSLSRYFSTRIYLYGRYDDTPGLKKDDRFGYLQVNELLSFGFNFKW